MAIDLDSIGRKIGPVDCEYTWKDIVLYALGVGAGFSELDYCYEKNLKPLPCFVMAAIMDFFWLVGRHAGINPAGVLHGEQTLLFHDSIPTEGTLSTSGRITHIYDKGRDKGALLVAESDTFHSDGKKLVSGRISIFARLDGGFGGQNVSSRVIEFPERQPDLVVADKPSENQPLIYRLTGDLFPLHIDPDFARAAGFKRPIMHGLCTHGFACRALINSLTPRAPESVKRIHCRFSKPLYPGEPIQTLIWKIKPGRAMWKTVNVNTAETVITNGEFEHRV